MIDMDPVFLAMTELDDDILLDAERAWERAPSHRRVLVPALASAACAALIAAGALTAFRGLPAARPGGPAVEPTASGLVPDSATDGPAPTVPDQSGNEGEGNTLPIPFNDVEAAPVGQAMMIALAEEDFHPMTAEESLEYFGFQLPEYGLVPGLELALTGGGCSGGDFGVYASRDGDVYYDANSYVFTDGPRRVTLTLRTGFNLTPSPEQVKNGPEKLTFWNVNGWDLAFFRYVDGNGTVCVYTEFVRDGVTCSVTTSGLGNPAVDWVLKGLLPLRECAPGPHALTGTVTAVDSRTGDYFDSEEHHYSQEHDYITVDCGDRHLTVWLPGQADRFRVGQRVTVTYVGEPATAYNIWPGQLLSVE